MRCIFFLSFIENRTEYLVLPASWKTHALVKKSRWRRTEPLGVVAHTLSYVHIVAFYNSESRNFFWVGEVLIVIIIVIRFTIIPASLHGPRDRCAIVHLQECGMRWRVEHISAVPWGLNFDTMEYDSGGMERINSVCLLKRELEII